MIKNIFTALFDPSLHTLGERLGFKYGEKGTHSSRTSMLEDLQLLLAARPNNVERKDYAYAVLEDNCLGKHTASTRKLSFQRLSELYGLDPGIPLFRVLRDLWNINQNSRPQLAILLALARDPLLRITATPVLETPFGKEFARQTMTDALANKVGTRFNKSNLDKIVRNASSSWTKSGHFRGRNRKFRQKVDATPVSCAYALLLGYCLRIRGQALFESPWAKVLDLDPAETRELADDAKRLGLLDIKESGPILDISFPQLLTSKDRELIHGTY